MRITDEHKKQSKILTILKRLRIKFYELSARKKIQVIIASLFTIALLIVLPVYAWYTLGEKIEAFTKIKEPDNLDIRAGHYDAAKYFNLNDIDIEKIVTEHTPHLVVFSVSAGDYKIPYQIQLAYTTNIPLTYKIYRAKEYEYDERPENPDVTYISEALKLQGEPEENYTFYYTKEDEVTLNRRNLDGSSKSNYGRELALRSGSYYNRTYDESDTPEIYAVPIYEQSNQITYDKNSDHDYFILEINWDSSSRQTGNFSEWNAAENKKETDMIYITASRYSQ